MPAEHWMQSPDDHDFPAAQAYLSLLMPPESAADLVSALQHADKLESHKAKDILRASNLEVLPVDNAHVASDLAKVKSGKKLSPVLLIRGEPLVVADGVRLRTSAPGISCRRSDVCHRGNGVDSCGRGRGPFVSASDRGSDNGRRLHRRGGRSPPAGRVDDLRHNHGGGYFRSRGNRSRCRVWTPASRCHHDRRSPPHPRASLHPLPQNYRRAHLRRARSHGATPHGRGFHGRGRPRPARLAGRVGLHSTAAGPRAAEKRHERVATSARNGVVVLSDSPLNDARGRKGHKSRPTAGRSHICVPFAGQPSGVAPRKGHKSRPLGHGADICVL
jgi:hypothetical protein